MQVRTDSAPDPDRDPDRDPGPAARAAIRETHISVVVFIGDRVYKLKKPVRLDFVDLSTEARRAEICRREIDLNRRLAPDVYLGTYTVRDEAGAPVDHVVVMRRLPETRRLATLVLARDDPDPHALSDTDTDIAGEVRRIARLVAAFHSRAESSPEISAAASPAAVRRNWEDNVATMAPFVGSILDPEIAARVATRATRYLDGRADLLAARIATGAIVDGHGDLQADDIFCLADGPRILDCIEFDDRLRYGDVLADITFLAMDLERLGAADLAQHLVASYREFSAATFPVSLAHHYIAYRAHVRSKVACLRAAQGDPDAATQARQLLDLADTHLAQGRVRLVLVGGLPGTGKSTLAAGIAARTDVAVIRSDEVRKDLAGLAHADHGDHDYGSGPYDPAMTAATYRTMLEHARQLLTHGESVVLDASWSSAAARTAARDLADATASDFVALRCDLDARTAAQRMTERLAARTDVSDATPAIAARMAGAADPWPDAVTIDTRGAPQGALATALGAI